MSEQQRDELDAPTAFVPKEGARFRFDLEEVVDGTARYRVTVALDGAVHTLALALSAPVSLGAGVELSPRGELAAWIDDVILAQGRTLAKNHASDGSWPRRLQRWRGPRA